MSILWSSVQATKIMSGIKDKRKKMKLSAEKKRKKDKVQEVGQSDNKGIMYSLFFFHLLAVLMKFISCGKFG